MEVKQLYFVEIHSTKLKQAFIDCPLLCLKVSFFQNSQNGQISMCDHQPRSQGPLLPVPAERETGTGRGDPGGTRLVQPPPVSATSYLKYLKCFSLGKCYWQPL